MKKYDRKGDISMQGIELQNWRESKGFSLSEMSDYLGIPYGTLRQWERGDRPIPQAFNLFYQLARKVEIFAPDIKIT